MSLLLVVALLLQTVGTPIADGALIVSSGWPEFPALPQGATPTPINDDWELLYYEVATRSDAYVIQGEIRNTSSNPLETPTIIVTFADGGQMGIHPDIDQADSGQRAPFRQSINDEDLIMAMNQSQEIEFTGVCEYYNVIPAQAFAWNFRNVEIEYDAARSAVRASGTVTNVGDAPAENYAPMLFGFTEDGHYVGSINAREVPANILSGDQFEFEMDHGFDSFSSDRPFSGAGRGAVFVLAMAPPVYVSVDCVG